MKVLAALAVIIFGALLFSWRDLFHVAVGIPLLVAGALLVCWWKKRLRSGEEDGLHEEVEEALPRRILFGAVAGTLFLLFLAAGFSVAARTPLADWIGGQNCPELQLELHILHEGRAYERMVQLVDGRIDDKISHNCRNALLDKKVRALWGWAENVRDGERLNRLRQAVAEARRIKSPDLAELAESKLKTAEQQDEIAEQRRRIADQRGEIGRLHRETQVHLRTIARQRAQITEQRKEIERMKRLLEDNRKAVGK